MKYLGYSELTGRLYILPASKKQSKIDITEDVAEYIKKLQSDQNNAVSDTTTNDSSNTADNKK